MSETIKEIIVWAAPLVAGFITSTIIPIFIDKFAKKKLQERIDKVNSGAEFKEINKQLVEIKKEILEMRGKRK